MFVWRVFPGRASARPGAFLTVPGLERSGIRVAFTNRTGGEQVAQDGSLNLSFLFGDDAQTVVANRCRALGPIDVDAGGWTGTRQVHGANVVGADAAGAGAWDAASTLPDADGLWTQTPGVALAVLTADCLPVVVADPNARRIAALHAGWRGLTSGVLEAGVEALAAAGSDPARLVAFIGPAIGPCCYEVGDDVAEPIRARMGDETVRVRGETKHADLWSAGRIGLMRAGVRAVWISALCTRCEPDRFFSHRAGAQGRQGAIVVLR